MENSYGIGVRNRYELFYNEDVDPMDLLKQSEKVKDKAAEKENKGKTAKAKAPVVKKGVKTEPAPKAADKTSVPGECLQHLSIMRGMSVVFRGKMARVAAAAEGRGGTCAPRRFVRGAVSRSPACAASRLQHASNFVSFLGCSCHIVVPVESWEHAVSRAEGSY